MKFEEWERWISIIGGAGTALPCVQCHFNHCLRRPSIVLTMLKSNKRRDSFILSAARNSD